MTVVRDLEMLLYNASKKIELLLNASMQKIVSPKSPKDTIYGTFLALALLFCGLFVWENLFKWL